SADLFADAFGSQQVAHPPTRADDTQRYAAARKVEVQLVQHARAREIDMGRRGEVADDQADVARGLRLKTRRYGFEDGVGIDIEQRGFRTERDHMGAAVHSRDGGRDRNSSSFRVRGRGTRREGWTRAPAASGPRPTRRAVFLAGSREAGRRQARSPPRRNPSG